MTLRISPIISLSPPKVILPRSLRKRLACHPKNTGINIIERAGAGRRNYPEPAAVLFHFYLYTELHTERLPPNDTPASDICLTAALFYYSFLFGMDYFISVTLTPVNSIVPAGVSASPTLPKENTRSPAVSLSPFIIKVLT